MNHVVLIGFMGSGKTTVGKALSEQLHYPLYDTDIIIEMMEGKPVAAIFETDGEETFRRYEKQIITELLNSREPSVIVCGGGTPCYSRIIDLLNECAVTVYLHVSPDILYQRLKCNIEKRPLLKNKPNLRKFIGELLQQREAVYNKAQILLNTDALTPEETAEEIKARLSLLLHK